MEQPPAAPPARRFNAMILAGGQSRRMGQDKARLEIAGIPLLLRVYAAACSAAHVYVVTTTDDYADLLPPQARRVTERRSAAPEFPASQGPLVGFAEGLAAMAVDHRADWLLLLACDLPWLSAATVEQWATGLPGLPPGTGAYLPRQTKGWEPLCGFYRPVVIANSLQQAVTRGERSFQRWLAEVAVEELPVADRRALANCNTPADRALMAGDRPPTR
jgi:molybdenum cofactor guanylyltransferase